MARNLTRHFTTLIACAFSVATAAFAEPVRIQSGERTFGQGWLFGSPKDASCWIVTPRHVVEKSRGGEVGEFQYTDLKGRTGEGVDVVVPKEGLDLAFAKVAGRRKGDCLSRLGADNISFAVARQPIAEAMKVLGTHASPRRMQIRDFSGESLIFEPVDKAAHEAMQRGLSGAPLLLRTDDGTDQPLGLIFDIEPNEKKSGFAVRFDVIKRLFLALDSKIAGSKEAGGVEIPGDAFALIDIDGVSGSPDQGPRMALAEQGCWIAAPREGKRSFRATLTPDDTRAFRGVFIEFGKTCGGPPDGIIIEIQNGKAWETIANCEMGADAARCQTAPRPRAPLRLTVISRSGSAVGIQQISLID